MLDPTRRGLGIPGLDPLDLLRRPVDAEHPVVIGIQKQFGQRDAEIPVFTQFTPGFPCFTDPPRASVVLGPADGVLRTAAVGFDEGGGMVGAIGNATHSRDRMHIGGFEVN